MSTGPFIPDGPTPHIGSMMQNFVRQNRQTKRDGMLFGHDMIRHAVEEMKQEDAPPRQVPLNPISQTPLDPVMVRRLEEVERRISRRLRWHWMNQFGCWSIQMFDIVKNDWQGVHICHIEDGVDPRGRPGFKTPDERDIAKFCYGWLEIRFNTGDPLKDLELAEAQKAQEKDQKKEAGELAMDRVLDLILTQGDAKRTAKVGEHLAYHGGDAGFREVFQVPRSSPIVVVKK